MVAITFLDMQLTHGRAVMAEDMELHRCMDPLLSRHVAICTASRSICQTSPVATRYDYAALIASFDKSGTRPRTICFA